MSSRRRWVIGARIADPSPGGLSGEDHISMSSPHPCGRERLATSAMSKLADTRTICQRVPTVIFHDRTSGRQSLQLGESGRARTDDPLLIGLDMPPCLTGVSLGCIAP
jgi:hypothetical protein